MKNPLADRPVLASVVATIVAAVAVIVIAHVTGADAIGRAFDHIDWRLIPVVAVAELLTYPAYMVAFRSIAGIHGHAKLSLPVVARVVVAGFGPFALSGGFGVDKHALAAIDEDERSARVRVMALGTLEWAVLAPITCGVAIWLLATGANVLPSLLWPWATAVPIGLGFAAWAGGRPERLARIGGSYKDWIAQALEGVGVIRTLIRHPRTYFGAWFGTTVYWLADMAAFYAALRVFGLELGPGRAVIAYSTGYAATRRSLPLGGAGITEVLMTYALYWVREPLAPALAAVLIYRGFNFLLIAVPALIANRQLNSTLERAKSARDRPRLRKRPT